MGLQWYGLGAGGMSTIVAIIAKLRLKKINGNGIAGHLFVNLYLLHLPYFQSKPLDGKQQLFFSLITASELSIIFLKTDNTVKNEKNKDTLFDFKGNNILFF